VNIEKQINYPDRWFYTLKEIKRQYIIEYEKGQRLSNSIIKQNDTCTTSCNSDKIITPKAFMVRKCE